MLIGLFPSALVQILWRRTRCLSVGPFFLYSISLVYFLLFCSKVGRKSCSGRLLFLLSALLMLNLSWHDCGKKNVGLLTLANLELFFFYQDLWGDIVQIKHVAWPQAYPAEVIHVLVSDCFRYFSHMLNFSKELFRKVQFVPVACLPSIIPLQWCLVWASGWLSAPSLCPISGTGLGC